MPPLPRARPMASISSMKTMHGAIVFAWAKRSRTRDGPTPTNISTKLGVGLVLVLGFGFGFGFAVQVACTGAEEATAACTRLGRVTRNQPASIPGYEPPKATHLFAGVSSQRRTA